MSTLKNIRIVKPVTSKLGSSTDDSTKYKWITYVVIGLLVIGIGILLYFILKKPKTNPPCTTSCDSNQCGSDDGCGGNCQTGSCNDPSNICSNGVCTPSTCDSSSSCSPNCPTGACPDSSNKCIDGVCTPSTYCDWFESQWSDCKNGIQSRDVICQSSNGTKCLDTNCKMSKPSTSQNCSTYCCDTTDWSCNSMLYKDCGSLKPVSNCDMCKKNIFPNNVYIFSTSMGDTVIQDKINNIFSTQGGVIPENNGQFSLNNYAFLFMPGIYNVDIPIGYYTHVAGLGKTNDKVIINGGPIVNNGSKNHTVGSLNNFWRTCENMTVNPPNQKSMIFAVSQATSLRSVNINGDLNLGAIDDDGRMGFASGGFMANCSISGVLNMCSQQQFLCRNTSYNSFPIALWNQVNVGCISNNPIEGCCINTVSPVQTSTNLTIIEKTPLIMEKPYLAVTNEKDVNSIVIMCPKALNNTIGVNNSIPINIIDDYMIVDDTITGSYLNTLLNSYKAIILSPGRYKIETPINLTGQLLFGLGLPVLQSTNNNNIIRGFGQMCGIIFETSSGGDGKNILVNLQNKQQSYLWDICCRVGGGVENNDIYSIDTMLYVGGDDSIMDNIWCWVADHYSNNNYTGWNKAASNIGIHVTGDNVIAYGLFSEHNRDRNVLWEGDKGQVYMFQSEFNYFPPDQKTFDDSVSYEVKSNKTHTLKGAGAYSFFPLEKIMAKSGFRFDSNVVYENILTVFLNGKGGIKNVLNELGQTVQYFDGNTQISILCGKNDLCRCTNCDLSTNTCQTDGRCKPNDSPCTDEQEKYMGRCSLLQWKCTNYPNDCYDTKQAAITSCNNDNDKVCKWW